jgi:hypothetical protein
VLNSICLELEADPVKLGHGTAFRRFILFSVDEGAVRWRIALIADVVSIKLGVTSSAEHHVDHCVGRYGKRPRDEVQIQSELSAEYRQPNEKPE